MTMVVTDGLTLMPAAFSQGLDKWSSQDGRPGQTSYAAQSGASFVAADPDFGGCLELLKTTSTQKIRAFAQTPILPGLYLRVTARVKAVAGALPAVRIAGYAANSSGANLTALTQIGGSTTLSAHGQVVEVSAIIGTGQRTGVNMVWQGAAFGHFGLDFTGANGGLLRVDDLVIEDVTHVFLRKMLGQVDVRDYGAKGDGVSNDAPAFAAADAAASGREIFVPQGLYLIDADLTITSRMRFEGRLSLPANRRLMLQGEFHLNSYIAAFGDEEVAFKRAYQALLNSADHEALDLCGRRITLSQPMDMQACDPARTTFTARRIIRNGQILPDESASWLDTVVQGAATYSTSAPLELSNVDNISGIRRGSLVEGFGVGREVYVQAVDVAARKVTLSQELFGAEGRQTFTFRRFKYLLDFSGYEQVSLMNLDEIDFQCLGRASGVMLAQNGSVFLVKDCFFSRPKDRGLTSIGRACQGLSIDRCQFLSNEQSLPVESRTSIGFNANGNDVKIRDNRVVLFKHFCVLAGTGSLVTGNHWFHGDSVNPGVRRGGMIFTEPNPQALITGNYIDNNSIEWTNEHTARPIYANQYSFGGMTITGNTFVAIGPVPSFSWLVIKPYGSGHFVHGLTVANNVFRVFNGSIERIERVDTTYADLDYTRFRNISFAGNTFNAVSVETRNPMPLLHSQATADRSWVLDPAGALPFNGRLRAVESVTASGFLRTAAGGNVHEFPAIEMEYGAGGRQARLTFATALRGAVRAFVRVDNPL